MKMELYEVINEINRTTPEDAKLTLCFVAGFLHERGFTDFAEAYEASPTRPEEVTDEQAD